MTHPEIDYAPWTLDASLEEARKAYASDAQPIYMQQQAYVLYAQQHYAEASAVYDQLFATSLRSPELFYEASRCKQMARDTVGQLALLDSCVAQFSRPYLKDAAPYLLARSQVLAESRFQYEVNGRLFQQALNDINKAITMEPQNAGFLAEKASLEVRVGLYDDAVATAQEVIRIAPDNSDGYLFLGVSQCLKGQKAEGVKNLQKAQELGDPQAAELIEKYSK